MCMKMSGDFPLIPLHRCINCHVVYDVSLNWDEKVSSSFCLPPKGKPVEGNSTTSIVQFNAVVVETRNTGKAAVLEKAVWPLLCFFFLFSSLL